MSMRGVTRPMAERQVRMQARDGYGAPYSSQRTAYDCCSLPSGGGPSSPIGP